MTVLTHRQKRHRRLLGVVVALWLSLGVQPCAIAAVGDLDCPHSPPAQDVAQTGMHAHHGASDASQPTGMASDCCETDEGALDARLAKLDLKPVGDHVTGPPASLITDLNLATFASYVIAAPPERRRSPVPLHILYCVYRD